MANVIYYREVIDDEECALATGGTVGSLTIWLILMLIFPCAIVSIYLLYIYIYNTEIYQILSSLDSRKVFYASL